MKNQSVKESLFFRGALFAVLAVGGFACAPSVPLQNRPCPCAGGWVCCPSGTVCAEDGNSCPGAGETAGNGGGMAGNGGSNGGGTAGNGGSNGGAAAGNGGSNGGGTAGNGGSNGGAAAGNGGSNGGGVAGSSMPPDGGLPTLPDPTYTVQPTLLGTWTGYFENFTFPSSSDGLRLSISQNADGTGKISVVLGMGPPPAPPTSAAATWPPTTNANSTMDLLELRGSYIEGFAYDAYDVQWDGGRLRFVINGAEPWQPYCELQTSHYVASRGAYLCIPGSGSGSGQSDGSIKCYATNGQPNPPQVSCMQAFACDTLCACDAAACGPQVTDTTAFDITFTGTKGEGNVTVGSGHDVMLTRIATPDGGQP